MMKKILLLDIENQTKKLKELTTLLTQYDQIILVYASSNLQISLNDLLELSCAIQQQKLMIMKMPTSGADSADFGLTFIAGRLSVELEKGSSVDVMSDDKKLSYAVELLKTIGINSKQIKQPQQVECHQVSQIPHKSDIFKASEVSSSTTAKKDIYNSQYLAKHPHLSNLKKYCDYLMKIKNNKPSKLDALKNSIKSVLKVQNDSTVLNILNLLKKYKIVVEQENRLTYNMVEINRWHQIKP